VPEKTIGKRPWVPVGGYQSPASCHPGVILLSPADEFHFSLSTTNPNVSIILYAKMDTPFESQGVIYLLGAIDRNQLTQLHCFQLTLLRVVTHLGFPYNLAQGFDLDGSKLFMYTGSDNKTSTLNEALS
jgi:hypothetical protein